MSPIHIIPSLPHQALATDFYQLTMMYAYHTAELDAEATFELFVRRLPRNRRFLVAAGLEQVLAYLRDLSFSGEDIDYLRSTPTFAAVREPARLEEFFERLRAYRCSATIRAVPEGTIFFPNEPVIQVIGTLFESQLIETYMLSTFNYQTIVASKAARMRLVADDRTLIDFGFRRAHGPQAAMFAGRASYVGGFDGTSDVALARLCGLPVIGTAAHSYTMAFQREEEAFAHYFDTYPESTTLLVDTYDAMRGIRRAAALGDGLKGIRLDSGDLVKQAKEGRAILDEAGLKDARIVASDGLNEYKIAALLEQGAPIDVFGVGTEMVTSRDDPTLAGVYKLVSMRREDGALIPTMKFSSSKASYPGPKDLHRVTNARGEIVGGALTQRGEEPVVDEGLTTTPLLVEVFRDGVPMDAEPLDAIRARTLAGLKTLSEPMRRIGARQDDEAPPRLWVSDQTEAQIEACEERFRVEANYSYTQSLEPE